METHHHVHFRSAQDLSPLEDESVALIVTSPPYPMIEMWDRSFSDQDTAVETALSAEDGDGAFAAMHRLLDRTWRECFRVLQPGGFACINIGDAVRTIGGTFRLYTNHSRITTACEQFGFQSLPAVIWRKQTNAPNKFMGSGMLPAGAYVTLEHEYILVFRKGGKRTFSPADRERRRRSAFFWEERNVWFSDLWDFKGVRQHLYNGDAGMRSRSGAYPLELPFRLINMYSLQGDTVVDPFLGTGTTTLAAIAAGRDSLGFEIDHAFSDAIEGAITGNIDFLTDRQLQRLQDHQEFVREYRVNRDHHFKHRNEHLDTPVMTGQERDLQIPVLRAIRRTESGRFCAEYRDPREVTVDDGGGYFHGDTGRRGDADRSPGSEQTTADALSGQLDLPLED